MLPFAAVSLTKSSQAASGTAFSGALAYRSGVTSESNSIDLPSEAYDTDSYHSGSTNPERLTAPSAGIYRFTSGVEHQGSGVDDFGHKLNGSTFYGRGVGNAATVGNNSSNLCSAPTSVSSGDYFQLDHEGVNVNINKAWGGIERMPDALQYAVVRKNAVQAVGSGSTTALTWQVEVADVGGWFDSGSPTLLTVPSGVSRVRVCAAAQDSTAEGSSQLVLSTYLNGATFRGMGSADTDVGGSEEKFVNVASAPIDVVAGDDFDARVFLTDADDIPAFTSVWFSIEEIPDEFDCCLVYKTGSQSISAATFTTLSFQAEVYDDNSIHDNSTNNSRLTAPSGATYARLSYNVQNSSTADQLIARVLKNGVTDVPGMPQSETDTAGTDNLNGMGAWVQCTGGDYFTLQVYSTNATSIGTGDSVWFAGEFRYD